MKVFPCIPLLVLTALPFPLSGEVAGDSDVYREIMPKVLEYSEATTDPDKKRIADSIGTGQKLASIQKTLADHYDETSPKERLALLYFLGSWSMEKAGAESALSAFPSMVRDFSNARPNHPNDLSFATSRVMDQWISFAWLKLPREEELEQARKPLAEGLGSSPPQDMEKKSQDGLVRTGNRKERAEIVEIIKARDLVKNAGEGEDYRMPGVEENDWIRIVGDYAFVRLRGKSSGTDYLFVYRDKHWTLLTPIFSWIS